MRSGYREAALGWTGASEGRTGGSSLEEEVEGLLVTGGRLLVSPPVSAASPSSSPPPPPSVYLKEKRGLALEEAWPRPNCILTEDTTLEGERSGEGSDVDRCMGKTPRPRPLTRALPRSGTCCAPARLSCCCLALSKALRTGEEDTG